MERSSPGAWCTVRKKHEPSSSGVGKALQYFTNHQVALARFLDYGYVLLDNGIAERLHIRAAMTRKNFLFAGADSGGDTGARGRSYMRLAAARAMADNFEVVHHS